MQRVTRQILLIFITLLASWSAIADFNPPASSTINSLGSSSNQFVTVDEAFVFNAYQQGDRVYIDWQIKPGYYLYQERLNFSAENAQLGEVQYPDGTPYHDEFFGDVHIYTEPLLAEVPLTQVGENGRLLIQYQGCAQAGFCYPPETRELALMPVKEVGSAQPSASTSQPQQPQSISTSQTPTSQQSGLAHQLAEQWWTPLLFLLLGIGLAFTPCVLPMYPILTSIVLGSGKLSHKRALGLAFVYVQGMALTYTLLGLVVASAGLQFQAALQHPYVLITLSVLFIALALSMFGVYTIQLPNRVQTWLSHLSNQQQGGKLWGVFAMGAISGLVCSPCTTAPLSGALLYVAQSGDLLTGGVALYTLALGMGIPLIIAAVFGNKLLPQAGEWMNRVKTLFGFILLAAPIFLLERILPESWSLTLWSLLGIAAFGWLYHAKNSLPFGGWKQSVVAIIAVLGLVASAQPLISYWVSAPTQATHTIAFKRISTLDELKQQLADAKQAGKPVMFDFYADWCVACKEFEKYTFHQPDVENKLKDFVLIQADVTKSMPNDIELMTYMKVLGLPTIEFWDSQGNHVPAARLTGFVKAQPFLSHLEAHGL
ncbi:protein-disulfide reductase DsbD [Vibrio olivae]|uniref:Thiol:disulfide interchange protein DsbD n=1 Tax=Vibrio olivae TaxID=1243002 RepID=A0ABV5HS20_9VIBR